MQSFSSRSGNLAAAVVEHVAKKPFADLLDERVFAPLQFTRTSLAILKVATQISLAWRDGALHFRDDGTSYRQPGPWIEMRHVAGEQYRLVQPHASYGTAVTVVRGPDGTVAHIVHGNRAFRKE